MNEDQIKQKLSDNLAAQGITDNDPGLVEDKPAEPTSMEVFHNNLPLDNMLLRTQVMDLIDIPYGNRASTETINQVDTITRWAIQTSQSNELHDVLNTIAKQKNSMNSNNMENKLFRMYRYVKLFNQRTAVEIQMREL